MPNVTPSHTEFHILTAFAHKEKELDILILAQRFYTKAILRLQTCS